MIHENGSHDAIHRLALRQHGVVARRQLIEREAGRRLIESWIERRRLFTIFRGVYALGRPATGFRAMWMAATLRAGATSALAGSSAAAAWGLIQPRRQIEVCRPVGNNLSTESSGVHRGFRLSITQGPLVGGDAATIGPLAVMSVARCLIWMAREESMRSLRRAFLSAGRSGLLTQECLDHCADRGQGFKGHQRLMGLIEHWQPDTGKLRSPLESEFLMLCGRFGIPAPRTNQRVAGYEVDCIWPLTKVIVELDGRRFHNDAVAFEDDRGKGNDLTAAGYTLLRFTYRMVVGDPEQVAQKILKEVGRN